MLSTTVDLFMVYQFIKRLAMPFTSWKAYELGVIDDRGNIVVAKAHRTPDQKKAFGKFDLMILKLKKLLAKVPGGSSKLASYMAALWLIKEWSHFSDQSTLNENVSENRINESLNLFLEWYLYYTGFVAEDNKKMFEDGAPTVNVGSGAIAGLGVGPQGEPGLTRAQQKRHRRKARATSTDVVTGRKAFSAFVGEQKGQEGE